MTALASAASSTWSRMGALRRLLASPAGAPRDPDHPFARLAPRPVLAGRRVRPARPPSGAHRDRRALADRLGAGAAPRVLARRRALRPRRQRDAGHLPVAARRRAGAGLHPRRLLALVRQV